MSIEDFMADGRKKFKEGKFTNIEAAMGWSEFGDAFKKSWSDQGSVIKSLSKHKSLLMEAAAVGAAGALVTDQVMYNNDVLSKDSAMALGLGAATAVGLPLAWAGGKKLKTSIYTGLKARASAKEAASKVADIFNGKAGVSEIGSI